MLYSSIIFLRTSSSSSFFVGGAFELKRASASVPNVSINLPPSSRVGIPLSGISYRKSSISCFVLFFTGSLGPDIIACEPKISFPIPLFPQIVGKTKGFFVSSTLKSVFGGGFGTLLNEMFVPPGAGDGGGLPLSIKSSIFGKEGGG